MLGLLWATHVAFGTHACSVLYVPQAHCRQSARSGRGRVCLCNARDSQPFRHTTVNGQASTLSGPTALSTFTLHEQWSTTEAWQASCQLRVRCARARWWSRARLPGEPLARRLAYLTLRALPWRTTSSHARGTGLSISNFTGRHSEPLSTYQLCAACAVLSKQQLQPRASTRVAKALLGGCNCVYCLGGTVEPTELAVTTCVTAASPSSQVRKHSVSNADQWHLLAVRAPRQMDTFASWVCAQARTKHVASVAPKQGPGSQHTSLHRQLRGSPACTDHSPSPVHQ